MAYRVELSVRAARDLDCIYQQIHAAESLAAARWYNGLEKAIYTLERFPHRCPVAREARKAKHSVRHLLYGTKPHVYPILYEIDQADKAARVLTIRHGAMDEFTAED